MRWLYLAADTGEIIRLLRAWRLWMLGTLIGALLGGLLFVLISPPFRARATVNVDFNLEQAWPQDVDRQQFYYLERESRKLEEIAWSDDVLRSVAAADGELSVAQLRDGRLLLSQPAEAGWRFYADDNDAARAQALASAWAKVFAAAAQENVSTQGGLNSYIVIQVTQAAKLPVQRSVPVSLYLLAGVINTWFFGFLILLFVAPQKARQDAPVPEPAP